MPAQPPRRLRRRAVGPSGAKPTEEPRLDVVDDEHRGSRTEDDDERLRRERPPHHDRGV